MHPEGVEPPTVRSVVWCSIQLSYGCIQSKRNPALTDGGIQCSLNGNRTRISALRGLRPRPLDDKAVLPRKDSNLDKQIQSLLSCR